MKIANITFEDAIKKLKEILRNNRLSFVKVSDIPSCLIQDFNSFNIGNTFCLIDKEEYVPYSDFKNWHNKIMYVSGVDYIIKWKK